MKGEKSKKEQKNKGVSAAVERSKSSSDSESCLTPCGRSINRVRNELQTVIELMGPTTPHFNHTSSNNADNEDSCCTTTSVTPVDKSKLEDGQSLTECDCSTLPPDVSLEENVKDQEQTNYSMMADKPSTMVDLNENETIQYICPPPKLPANFVFNSECMCPQMANYIQNNNSGTHATMKKPKKQNKLIQGIFKTFKEKRADVRSDKCKYYKMNIKQSQRKTDNPRRLIFDLVDDIPKPRDCQCNCQLSNIDEREEIFGDSSSKKNKNLRNELLSTKQDFMNEDVFCVDNEYESKYMKNQQKEHHKTTYTDSNGTTRVDVYYFDHGSSSYLRTTDKPPVITTEVMAEKTEMYTTKFWAELFGTFHIGFSFFTSFILQSTRFLLYSIIRPLTVGMIQLISDYFLKPLLATLFNACIQPTLILFYNIASSVRDCCDPIAEGVGYFLREVAFIIRAFRIVEVKNEKCSNTCKCGKESGNNRIV